MADTDIPALPKGATLDMPPMPKGATMEAPPLPEGATMQRQEPDLGSKLYGAGYGLVTGALGIPGELESMVTPKAPIGSPLRGHETVFPTVEEFQKGIEKYAPSIAPAPGTENWQLVGELAPAIYGGGKLLYKGGEYVITRGNDIIKRWRGGPLQEAESALTGELGTATQRAGSGVSAKAKTEEERLRAQHESEIRKLEDESRKEVQRLTSEQVRRGTAQRSVGRQLEAGAERAKAESVTALNQIAKPTNDYQLGSAIRGKVTGVEKNLSQAVDAEATRLKDLYLKEGAAKEKAGQYWSQSQTGKEFLKYLKSVVDPANSGKYPSYEVQAARKLMEDLSGKKVGGQVVRSELPKIESIIRETKKLPSQPAQSGAQAQVQQAMGRLAQKLEDSVYGYVDEAGAAIEGFAPTGRVFRETYRDMMKPLNAYESPVGKVITQQVERLKGIFTSDATAVPGAVFRSPEQIQVLERMGVGKSTLEPYAKQYTANQLSKFNKAEDAANWLKSTEASYLQEFPDLLKKAEKYAATFAKNEAEVAAKAGTATKLEQVSKTGAQKAREDIEKLKSRSTQDIAKLREKAISDTEKLRNMSVSDRKEITDGLYKVMNARVENMPAQARTYILNLKNKGFIEEGEATRLLDQVRNVEQARLDKESAASAMRGLLPYGAYAVAGTSVLGYSLNKLLGGL